MTKSLTMFLGLAALAACSKPSPHARNPGAGDVSSLDACALLTPTEIQQALGVAMKPGVKQTTSTSSQCQWDSQDESEAVGVSVSVATYDDALFRTQASAKGPCPCRVSARRPTKVTPMRETSSSSTTDTRSTSASWISSCRRPRWTAPPLGSRSRSSLASRSSASRFQKRHGATISKPKN